MKIIIVGTFPPPVHGMAIINQAIFEHLILDGWDVEKINTSPQSLSTQILPRMTRIGKYFSTWSYLLNNNLKNSQACLALSGGWGQIYDVITVLLCRIKGAKCVLHHHSVAYLDKKRFITALLFRAAGRDAVHIALCEGMRKRLEKQYGCRQVALLSNITLSFHDIPAKERDKIRTIGYLSNVTKEKGGWDVIRLANKIYEKGWPIKYRVAGPCQDIKLNQALRDAQERGVLEWVGPVFDDEKRNFLRSLDVFIFPSQNEAEPLVVWEALLSEIPVIAYDRGCVSAQVGEAGKIIPAEDDFSEAAVKLLEAWIAEPKVYQQCVRSANEKREIVVELAEKQWRDYTLILESGLASK